MNRPMMHHIVALLKKHDITDLVATLFYQPEAITSYFGNGSSLGVSLTYVKAEADYGTAGSVRNALSESNDRVLVISGDVLTDCDLTAAINFHLVLIFYVVIARRRGFQKLEIYPTTNKDND